MIQTLLVLAAFGTLISTGNVGFAIWFAMGVAVALILKVYKD